MSKITLEQQKAFDEAVVRHHALVSAKHEVFKEDQERIPNRLLQKYTENLYENYYVTDPEWVEEFRDACIEYNRDYTRRRMTLLRFTCLDCGHDNTDYSDILSCIKCRSDNIKNVELKRPALVVAIKRGGNNIQAIMSLKTARKKIWNP